MGSRRQGRELALQALYLSDISKIECADALQKLLNSEKWDDKTRTFAKLLASGTQENISNLDKIIMKYTDNWELNRMAALDRNLLRLSSFEILFESDTPISVIINEAVEIAKAYSTPDSGKFVNGILDKVKLERGKSTQSSVEN